MATTSPILLRATFPDVDGIAADDAVNAFVFASADIAAAVAAVKSFYLDANSTSALSGYLSSSRSRVAGASLIQTYELAGFLHGEPHGSPIQTDTFTLGAPSGSDLPDQVAAVLSYHGDLTALPEHGPTVSRPASEESIDQGAVGTYLAKTRPRASLRGRLYLGPLTFAAIGTGGEMSGAMTVDLITAAHRLRLAVTGTWGVWSRTYGTVTPISGGWIDVNMGVQRRRKDKAPSRTAWV